MEADENIDFSGEDICPYSEVCGYSTYNCDGDYRDCDYFPKLDDLAKTFGNSFLDGDGPKLLSEMNDEYDRMAASKEIEPKEA